MNTDNPSILPNAAIGTPTNESQGQNARTLLNDLRTGFAAFRDCLPLAIGIDKQVKERLPDVDKKLLRIALGIHTHSLRYLKSVEKATHRYDLDGNVVTELLDEHRQHAAQTLKERLKKDAERRRVQREAEAQESQRLEKMNQLVEKFGKKR